ncbi:MAG: DUF4190 domain-containing protein [Lachnospiraceae bacterium]|nr:DUF4190 domain-containing protein [Lachnospiraceae bacterium]
MDYNNNNNNNYGSNYSSNYNNYGNNMQNNMINNMPGSVPPMYAPPVQANPNNGMAVGSLVCGILSLVLCCCCGFGIVLSIIGLILGIMSKSKNGGKLSGMAIAGIICSGIGVVAGIIGIFYMFGGGFVDAFIDGFYEGYYGYY